MVEPLMATVVEWLRQKFAWTGFLRPTSFEKIDIAKARAVEKQKLQDEQGLKGVSEERRDKARADFQKWSQKVWDDDNDGYWLERYDSKK